MPAASASAGVPLGRQVQYRQCSVLEIYSVLEIHNWRKTAPLQELDVHTAGRMPQFEAVHSDRFP
jgi:hypothetical protein